MKLHRLLMILVAAGLTSAAPANDQLGDALVAIERALMERLAAQQGPGVEIKPFKTDGCSGGQSAVWKYLANSYPQFARLAGDKPPWEHCCVEHDRYYWRGESRNGFEQRREADRILRQCVVRTGQRQQHLLASRLGITPDEVTEFFTLSADMMYQAVRLGGGPCTGLPWRWGHGWPECNPAAALAPD